MNTTTIWYSMATSGEAPARIWPVIIPGSWTTPTVIRPLTVGIIAARTAERTIGCTASGPEKPRASMASISSVRTRRSDCRRSPASAALVIALPRIIPAIGMTYCGSYHGWTRTTTAITHPSVIAVETTIAVAAISYRPGMGFFRRETAAWVATSVIAISTSATQYHRPAVKTDARMTPTR